MPQPDPGSERELRIARVLRPLGKAPLTREQAERAGQLLGVHPSTVYRLRARFLRNPVTSAVKQSRGGRPRGRRLLNGPLEAVVSEVVEAWLPKQRHLAHPVLECYQEVKRRCRSLQLAPPARNTVAQRIEQHRAAELALLAAQPAAEKAPGSFGATWPLEIVQIDHTLADVLIVDRFTRRVIGRPWVSVAIDLATRSVPAPQGPSTTLASLEQVARDILLRMAPRMLIVDEVHHLLAGSHREQRASLNLLKYLANELKMSIVAVGTSDAPVAFQSDAQVYSRFAPFEIPRWSESEDFRRLLSAFEAALPLKRASDLTQRPIVQFLIAASGGLLGEVSRLLNDAAEQAIHDGSEQITLAQLEVAAHAHA